MKYLLGIDFGGDASKATLIDTMGNIIAESIAEYPTLYPFPGACEQSPSDWMSALCENVTQLLTKSQINSADILCIAIDSATHTAVVCDKDKKPLRPAIHWTDSRSKKQADFLKKQYGDEIFKRAFHRPDTIWTLPHLMWIRENESEIFGKIGSVFFEKRLYPLSFDRDLLCGFY